MPTGVIIVSEDINGAIKLSENLLSSARRKHIGVSYHCLGSQCLEGDVKQKHVSYEEQDRDVSHQAFASRSIFVSYKCFDVPEGFNIPLGYF